MNVDIFAYTDVGSRQVNEDYYTVKNDGGRCIAVLCDGLGGHNCGEVASKIAGENIVTGLDGLTEYNHSQILSVLETVNSGIINQQKIRSEWQGMRTTAVGCVVENNRIHYFNVGDSRFYYFKHDSLRLMTKDHSVSQMSVEMGQLKFDDIRFDADRSKLLKVLGEASNGNAVGSVYRSETVSPGDAFLLCSDGFWEYVYEEEMEIDLSKSNTAEEWVKFMLVRLLLRMNGKNDNFTVVGGIIR